MRGRRCIALSYLSLMLAIFLGGLNPLLAENSAESRIIRLATTTSTENSGLLGFILPQFTEQTAYHVHVIAVGTGKALRMGRDGDVDVIMVHAPSAEAKFVAEGHGVKRHSLMYNDFVIIGPARDPAAIRQAANAIEAMTRIANQSALFVSRGDDSGTHKKENSLWHNANHVTKASWYREAGQGMGKVIQIASELDAYTLADRGTWIAYQKKSSLKLLYQGDPILHNPYGVIAVNPQRYPDANYAGARVLIDWLLSETGQALIADFKVAGFRLFTPSTKAPGAMAIMK